MTGIDRPEGKSVRVSFVIPHWNKLDLLEKALKTLDEQTFQDFEVIIIENGSTDGSVEFIKDNYPDIRLIELAENVGYAPAANLGIQDAVGEYIAFYSNDVYSDRYWLERMVRTLDTHPDIGFCGCKILSNDNPDLIYAAGDTYTLGGYPFNLGQGEREAELSAIISRRGSGTGEGREAMYELARIYIYKSGSKQNLAPDILDELIGFSDVDPEYAAKAYYLYGEYYYRKNELQKAAQSFLQTVLTFPDNRDLSAQALYRAAEMAIISGNRKDAEELVGRIETLFPSSSWKEEGQKLLGGDNE